jgi:hypothetical protein
VSALTSGRGFGEDVPLVDILWTYKWRWKLEGFLYGLYAACLSPSPRCSDINPRGIVTSGQLAGERRTAGLMMPGLDVG